MMGADIVNLLAETHRMLIDNDKSPNDVCWVGSRDGKYAMSWDEFAAIANITYDAGYGGQEIAFDLVVVGNNWWLERYEYDGAENWVFKSPPLIQVHHSKFTVVKGDGWEELRYMNGETYDWGLK